MKVYAVKDNRTEEFITHRDGRFIYTRRADAQRLLSRREWYRKSYQKEEGPTPYYIAEGEVLEWKQSLKN